jgi:hypothetical protein
VHWRIGKVAGPADSSPEQAQEVFGYSQKVLVQRWPIGGWSAVGDQDCELEEGNFRRKKVDERDRHDPCLAGRISVVNRHTGMYRVL